MVHEMPHRGLAYWLLGFAVLLVAGFVVFGSAVGAQPPGEDEAGPSAPASGPATTAPTDGNALDAPAEPTAPAPQVVEGIKFIELMISGGWFMVPIVFMSLLMVVFSIERFIALRRDRLMPQDLVTQLGELGSGQGGFDPRQAYRVCQQYPCAASSVIRAMLLKVGRPHSEIEHAVAEASERAAERAYSNVRWLNLCTSVTPLMGLLGTVWGMIVAFHQTTQLGPGQDRATQLAEGIYIALVTTLGGLMVAIPSAVLAHFFEVRIVGMFHEVDELLFNLLPLVERYEGRVRFSQKLAGDQPGAAPPVTEPPPVPATPRPT